MVGFLGGYGTLPQKLLCSCGAYDRFEIQFHKSDSVLTYEQVGGKDHPPDIMKVCCTSCGAEITITETAGKMPPRQMKEEAYQVYVDDQIRRSAGMPPPETYTTYGPSTGSVRYNDPYEFHNTRKMQIRVDPGTGTHIVWMEE